MAKTFKHLYRCYPIPEGGPHTHLNNGDKILMPASAFEELSTMRVQYPLLFKLTSHRTGQATHCGVMEFSADEGEVLLPDWLMRNMDLLEGDFVELSNVTLKKATSVRLRPHETAFVELSDPRAVLETTLRQFSCLTVGDSVTIDHAGRKFVIDVLETKPDAAVSIIETDCEVDFATPLDYKEPEKMITEEAHKSEETKTNKGIEEGAESFVAFSGVGRRLGDGVSTSIAAAIRNDVTSSLYKLAISESRAPKVRKVAVGDCVHKVGMKSSSTECCGALKDNCKSKGKDQINDKKEEKGFKPFSGKSYSLM